MDWVVFFGSPNAGELITDKGNVHFRYNRTAKQLMANRIMHIFLDFIF